MKKKTTTKDPMHYKEYTLKEIKETGEKYGLELFDSLGYELHILSNLGLGIKERIMMGYYFPFIADRIIIIFKTPNK